MTRQRVQHQRNELHTFELELQRAEASRDALNASVGRLMIQIESNQRRKSELAETLDHEEEPITELNQQLQKLLQQNFYQPPHVGAPNRQTTCSATG